MEFPELLLSFSEICSLLSFSVHFLDCHELSFVSLAAPEFVTFIFLFKRKLMIQCSRDIEATLAKICSVGPWISDAQ